MLLTAYYLLRTTYCSLLTTYYLLLTTYYSLLTARLTYYLLLTTYCVLLTTYRWKGELMGNVPERSGQIVYACVKATSGGGSTTAWTSLTWDLTAPEVIELNIYDSGEERFVQTYPCGETPPDCKRRWPVWEKRPDAYLKSRNELRFQVRVVDAPFRAWSSIAALKWSMQPTELPYAAAEGLNVLSWQDISLGRQQEESATHSNAAAECPRPQTMPAIVVVQLTGATNQNSEIDGLCYIVSQLFSILTHRSRARSRRPGAGGARRDSMGER